MSTVRYHQTRVGPWPLIILVAIIISCAVWAAVSAPPRDVQISGYWVPFVPGTVEAEQVREDCFDNGGQALVYFDGDTEAFCQLSTVPPTTQPAPDL